MYKAWGDNFLYYHLTSIVLHSFNGYLLYKCLKKLGGSNVLVISLLYLVHPLNFYTVSWIIQIKTLLCIFFFLISLNLFLDHLKNNSQYRYWLSVVMFGMSLLSKSAFAPIVLLMLFYKNRSKMIPYVVICVYSILLTGWSTHIKGYIQNLKVSSYIINESMAEDGLKKTLPSVRPMGPPIKRDKDPLRLVTLSLNNLARYSSYIIYPNEVLLVNSKTEVNYSYKELIVSLLVVFVFIYLIFNYWLKKDYISLCGLMFFLISLIPLTGVFFIPIFNYTNFVSYWLSVPVLGLVLCLGRGQSFKKTKQVIVLFFLGVFSYQTILASRTTPEPISMIQKSIDVSPENVQVKLILSAHYRFIKKYEKSNEILFKVKQEETVDKEKIQQEIEENFSIMNGEKHDRFDF